MQLHLWLQSNVVKYRFEPWRTYITFKTRVTSSSTDSNLDEHILRLKPAIRQTYLAYQIGLTVTTIIISVAVAARTLSKPWEVLKGLCRRWNFFCGATSCWWKSVRNVLETPREVLERPCNICEMLLWFHRNGIADEFITAAFYSMKTSKTLWSL
jgi:hypothetical protein